MMTYETIVTKTLKEPIVMAQKTDVYQFFSKKYKPTDTPQMLLMTLGISAKLHNVYIIHLGNMHYKSFNLRDICEKAIMDKAREIIFCLIRPESSDVLEPSANDYGIAEKIFKAMEILNIGVRHQLIISKSGYTEITLAHNEDEDE